MSRDKSADSLGLPQDRAATLAPQQSGAGTGVRGPRVGALCGRDSGTSFTLPAGPEFASPGEDDDDDHPPVSAPRRWRYSSGCSFQPLFPWQAARFCVEV